MSDNRGEHNTSANKATETNLGPRGAAPGRLVADVLPNKT